jgi:hypothetical protein
MEIAAIPNHTDGGRAMSTQIRWQRLFVVVVTLFFVAAILAGCRGVAEEAAQTVAGPTVTADVTSPTEVTEAFYTWYVEAVDATFRGERQAAAGGLYHESTVLTRALLEKLDRTREQGFDPVLYAQDLPDTISVEVWAMDDSSARVIVYELWSGASTMDLTVDLIRHDGMWMLDDIRPGSPATPEGTTQLFYHWYLDYAQAGDMARNPLVDGAYRTSELLSPSFVAKVDGALAEMAGSGYDPILLAQDLPIAIEVVATTAAVDTAIVTINRYFGGNAEAYPMQVHLLRQDDQWRIDDVSDLVVQTADSPVVAVEGFYSWYLAYIGDPAGDHFRNPLVDRAYREAPYVSNVFVAEMDALLDQEIDEFGAIMADPILQAQAIPTGFAVLHGPAEDVLTANLFFGETVHPVQVRVVQEDGVWLVDGIIPRGSTLTVDSAGQSSVDTTGWQTVVAEDYGFSFLLPPGWVAEPMDMDGPGIPDGWPVRAGYMLMPQTVAEALAARTGPPDPNAGPEIVFLLEVMVGDQDAFNRVYVSPVESTTATYNGNVVHVERDSEEYTVVRYVFQHPADEQVVVVLSDSLSEFPGREALAAQVAEIVPGILGSFTFTR